MDSHRSEEAPRIALIGPFGYGNLGDAATQDAMIQNIRARYPAAEIFGFSLDPDDTEARHGIKSFPSSWRRWLEPEAGVLFRLGLWLEAQQNPTLRKLKPWVVRAPREFGLFRQGMGNMRGMDMLIVSGGGQLQDFWGSGAFGHPYTVFKWGVIAKLRGAKFTVVSVGAGPINAPISRRFFKWALSIADYRSYRDEFSKRFMQGIGFDNDDPVYPDLVYSLRVPPPLGSSGAQGPGKIVGIAPIAYFKKDCWPREDPETYAKYLQKMVELVIWLTASGHQILFFPGEAHYDQLVVTDILDEVEKRGAQIREGQILRPNILTVEELLKELSRTDLVIVSRFHSALLAHVSSKPVLALSYHYKVDTLMKEAGEEEYCLPVGTFELEQVKSLFSKLEANLDGVREQLDRRTRACRAQVAEQYDRVFALL